MPALWAISDLHIGYQANREIAEGLRPESDEDWLLVAGDVSEQFADVQWALSLLRERFAEVVWAPGNHELWTPANDPVQLRGQERYEALTALCDKLGVHHPEGEYQHFPGPDGPIVVAPLFVGYDYTFLPPGTASKEEGLAYAHKTGIICTDEYALHPDPYPTRDDWCHARVTHTEQKLNTIPRGMPIVLVNHYPTVREPMDVLWYPEFAMWCGTTATADWHVRYDVHTMVYGHLHIPRTTHYDGVRFEEVSVGYPREWQRRPTPPALRLIVPG